uniref:Uncharacterized protein n=1 Tax=Glossina austeni TaxID=7395 RepID=A0A1A9V436_GLOAU
MKDAAREKLLTKLRKISYSSYGFITLQLPCLLPIPQCIFMAMECIKLCCAYPVSSQKLVLKSSRGLGHDAIWTVFICYSAEYTMLRSLYRPVTGAGKEQTAQRRSNSLKQNNSGVGPKRELGFGHQISLVLRIIETASDERISGPKWLPSSLQSYGLNRCFYRVSPGRRDVILMIVILMISGSCQIVTGDGQ